MPDLDLGHPPRVGAEQEDVARGGLDGEVLVHRAHRHAVGVEHDAVVTGLGDGAAAGERGQAGAATGAQAPVHRVVVQVRAAAPPTGLDTPRRQGDRVVEVLPRQVGVRCSAPGEVPHRLDLALTGGGDLGHQLLDKDVERGDRRLEQVEPALTHGGQQGRALDELVPRGRVQPAGRRAVAVVVGPADALEKGADGPGRSDLADQLDRPDIDTQLERGGRDESP